MKKFFIVLMGVALCVPAFASVKCGNEYIKGVQIKSSGEIIYTSKAGVRRLIGSSETQATNEYMLQFLLKAVDKNYYVQAAFPDGYSCKSSNTEVAASWIYVQNPNK
jgi:hypothetical protein